MQLSPRQRWKLRQYQNSIEAFKEQVRDTFKGAMAKQKICPACRALVSAKETRCPFCNEYITAFNRVGVRRLSTGVLPDITYTKALLGLNFFLFAVSLVAATKEGAQFGGLLGLDGFTLIRLGSNYSEFVRAGQYWRLLTGAFLHGSLIHLLFNMYALSIAGDGVEEMYGSSRFIVAYVWAALCGSLASYWAPWHSINNMVGASGAIFGLIGVMIAYGYRNPSGVGEHIRSMYTRWAIYGLIYGLMPGVDNTAHIGGMLGGLAFGFLVSDMPPVTRESIMIWRVLNYICWLAIAGGIVMIAVTMVKGLAPAT